MSDRWLIVNADDFGRSANINDGIVRTFEQGIVTSASLMVRWPQARDAADYARTHAELSVGLHFDLSEWSYRDGWVLDYQVLRNENPATVQDELDRQLDTFHMLVGRPPTHLDSHQHVHLEEPAHSALARAGERLGVPVRSLGAHVQYRGDFYGQTQTGGAYPEGVRLESLLDVVASLPEGITELGCHPASDPEYTSTYSEERPQELAVLCDPRVRDALDVAGVGLRSFAPRHENEWTADARDRASRHA